MKRTLFAFLAGVVPLMISACGGGGGGNASSSAANTGSVTSTVTGSVGVPATTTPSVIDPVSPLVTTPSVTVDPLVVPVVTHPVTTVVLIPAVAPVCFGPRADNANVLDDKKIVLGDYTVGTNAWGRGTTPAFTDCVSGASFGVINNNVSTQTGVSASLTWNWYAPFYSTPTDPVSFVKAYPEILYRPNGQDLQPILISDVAQLTAHHDVTLSSPITGDYNVTYDIWIDSTPGDVSWPHDAEIMIKLQGTWGDQSNLPAEVLTVNGNQYNVIYNTGYSVSGNWSYIVFQSINNLLKADIPIQPFVNYLVAHNHLLMSDHISTLEFGSEINNGAGTTTINAYSVTR